MTAAAEIQHKAPKPQGLLPKNVQSWLLIVLAFLMVAIMWLTGGNKPLAPTKTPAAAAPAQIPLEVNETKINELQSRIEQLQREQLVAQSALAQQTRWLGPAAPQEAQTAEPQNVSGYRPEQRSEDPIQAERKRRAYTSLFSSNVALTFRHQPSPAASVPRPESEPTPAAESVVPVGPDSPPLAQLVKEMQSAQAAQAATTPPPAALRSDSPEAIHERKEEARNPAAVAADSPSAAAGKTYLLFEGTILETVLVNRLDGGFTGPVECLLSTNVYSNDRQHLLVPAGSKLLGETRKVDTFGQTRLAVVFHRLLMPDGYSVSLDQFKGLNQIGDTGLRDQVDNHYLRIFGVSLAIGALGAVAEGGTAGSLNATSSDLMRQGFAQSTAQSSAQILDKFLNIMPTVTIREGHRVKVYLSGDLALPDYTNHKMPADL
jgi:type IV secretion system protein TrbI